MLKLGTVEIVAHPGDRCGEGALWHAGENALYWTDINRFLVHRLRLENRAVESWSFAAPVVGLSLTDDPERLLVALGSGLLLWSPRTDSRAPAGFELEGWPAERLNDGRTDPAGRFWVGSMRNNVGANGEPLAAGGNDGKLFRIGGGAPEVFRTGIGISNTLAWSPDHRTFYFADTLANVIWAHDYDETTVRIGPPRVFFSGFDRGSPDGSTVDAEGYLWNCRFGGGCIVRLAPDGQIERVIDMPVTNPTTAVFGGKTGQTLYVTSASIFAPPTERPAGSLFAIETNVAGLPENRFRLA